jgi:transposase InsO family protein
MLIGQWPVGRTPRELRTLVGVHDTLLGTHRVADITYVRTRQGFFYLAMVLDVFSRRLVGWMMGDSLRTERVLAALEMALHRRATAPPTVSGTEDGLIHHSAAPNTPVSGSASAWSRPVSPPRWARSGIPSTTP